MKTYGQSAEQKSGREREMRRNDVNKLNGEHPFEGTSSYEMNFAWEFHNENAEVLEYFVFFFCAFI